MVKKSILAKVGDKINYKLIRDGYKTGKGNVVVTAEMDTKTTIIADVPSIAYASNLDYEVDISDKNPPIINIKNDITCPDDTVISKGKYLFYDIGQEYAIEDKNKIIEPIKNYTKVGNVSVDSNGIVSNFSTSNYIKLNTYLPSTFDIVIKYKHNSVTDSQPGELIANPTTDNSLYIYYSSERSRYGMTLYVSGVGASFETNNPVQYETGSWYWIRLIYNGNEAKIYVIKDNNYTIKTLPPLSSWNHELTKPVSNLWKDMYVTIGANIPYGKYNTGSIDLNNTYIYELGTSYTSYLKGIKDPKLQDTGTELTTKLFDYHYKVQGKFINNTIKVGNVIINESTGIASGFTSSIKLKFEKSNYYTNERRFYTKLITGSVSGTTEFLWNFTGNDYGIGISGNAWRIWNGGSIYGTGVSANSTYWTCIVQNSSGTSLYVLQDNTNKYTSSKLPELSSWVKSCSTSTQLFGDNDFCYGGSTVTTSEYWTGTIDLLNSWIETDGEKRFLAYFAKPQNEASLYINSEKDNNLYYEKDGLQLNVSKVGTAAVDENGIASNFGNNSYVTFGKLNAGDNPWEMVFKVKYKEHSGFQRFCGSSSGNPRNLLITVSNKNKLILCISTNGSEWNISRNDSKTTLVNDTTYYIKALFNGTNYILLLSTDGINYNEEINEASTTPMYNGVSTNFQIGCAFSDESQYNWQGTIDLKESYIQIGTNEKKYFAENIKKRYDIPSLYSEFVDNITIPAHALYEYVNGEWKLSSTSPVITQDITVNADNAEITMKEIEE